jgi:hypothetical protein
MAGMDRRGRTRPWPRRNNHEQQNPPPDQPCPDARGVRPGQAAGKPVPMVRRCAGWRRSTRQVRTAERYDPGRSGADRRAARVSGIPPHRPLRQTGLFRSRCHCFSVCRSPKQRCWRDSAPTGCAAAFSAFHMARTKSTRSCASGLAGRLSTGRAGGSERSAACFTTLQKQRSKQGNGFIKDSIGNHGKRLG